MLIKKGFRKLIQYFVLTSYLFFILINNLYYFTYAFFLISKFPNGLKHVYLLSTGNKHIYVLTYDCILTDEDKFKQVEFMSFYVSVPKLL